MQHQERTERSEPFFDLEVEKATPFVASFSLAPLRRRWREDRCRGRGLWHTMAVPSLSNMGMLLLINRAELTAARDYGSNEGAFECLPFVLLREDGRYVGRPTHSLAALNVPRPDILAWWIQWDSDRADVTGLCNRACPTREAIIRPIEARNEERFYMSDMYVAVSQAVKNRTIATASTTAAWKNLEADHFTRTLLENTRKGAIFDCLKKKYEHCPFVYHSASLCSSSSSLYICVYVHGQQKKDDENKDDYEDDTEGDEAAFVLHLEGRIVDMKREPYNISPEIQQHLQPQALQQLQQPPQPVATFKGRGIRSSRDKAIDFEEYFRNKLIAFFRASVHRN